ncbi:MAG: DNA polymerase domain-containing protein [Ignisphaera sp.]|uniref:DNA polymerase domain-containing protein n=1 Tax=Thermofilum sp. TaxID=1961369 RepID=UPI0031666472
MKVRAVAHSGNSIRVLADGVVKRLKICSDVECPHAFTYREFKDKVESLGARVFEANLRHHLSKKPVLKYECHSPSQVAKIRDAVGYDATFEADVPYLRRLFIDRVLEPDYSDAFVWLDIEVDDSKGFPKPERDKIVSLAFSLNGRDIEFLHLSDFDSEGEMLGEFSSLLIRNNKSVAVGWNVGFDLNFLKARGGDLFWFLSGLDLMEKYKDEVKGLENYTLENVARHEGVGAKSRSKRVSDMSRHELMDYNTNDVRLLLGIDEKYNFTGLTRSLAEFVGLLIDDLTPIRIGDALIIRRARELGYVLSNAVRAGKKGYKGAFVAEPLRKGLVRNVAVLDFESLYPNIIINERVDIPGFNGEVVPFIERQLLDKRREAKKKLKETGDKRYDVEQQTYKIVANSIYGLFGTAGFRFFDEKKAEFITSKGRELISYVFTIVESFGYAPIYGDTDSVFITGWSDFEELVFLEELINRKLSPYRMKLEYFGDMYIMAKKRYIFRKHDGTYIYKGVEVVRSDWSRFEKMIVDNIVRMVFEGNSAVEIRRWLESVKRDLFAGRYDDMLAVCKGFDPHKKYVNNAEHVKAVREYVRLTGTPIEFITRICYYYTPSGVFPVVEAAEGRKPRIDYMRYWARVQSVIKRVLVSG